MRLSLFFMILMTIIAISILLWFFLVAKIANLDTSSFDYCDIIMILICLEVFLLTISTIGFFNVPGNISFRFFAIISLLFMMAKLIFHILFYFRQENKLFQAQRHYFLSKSLPVPEKLQAFQAAYITSGLSWFLEFIFLAMGLYFANELEKLDFAHHENDDLYIEII